MDLPSRTLGPALLALTAIGCTGPPAEVVIDTRIGDATLAGRPGDEGHSWAELQTRAALVQDMAERWWERREAEKRAAAAAESPDAQLVGVDYEPAPPAEAEALLAQLEAIHEGPVDEIAVPVRNLAEAGPELWPQVREALLAERERPKREYKQVLGVIGGDVPNRYGHFALHWKKAHGYKVRVSEDWYEDMLALEPARVSKLLRPVYRDILATCALLEAASKIAREEPELVDEVVAALLDAAYMHKGSFRDEVGRAIDAIGDPAIPHLMRESVIPEDAEEGSVAERRAEYAGYCLDRMDRLHPQRAIEAVADDRRLLADVLGAYAAVRDGEAAPLLLDFVDADQPGVRAAARTAFESYVTGPLPKVRRKSVRLLGGGTTTRRAELSYREHARLAIRDRLAKQEPELLEDECDLWLEGGVIDADCERQPERLFRAYVKLLDERRASRRDALIARALSSDHEAGAAMLDTLLTDGTSLGPEGAELIAPFYAEVAAEVETQGDPARAAQLLRKSAMLIADADPVRARELTVDALVLESAVEGVDPRGREMLLNTALDLAPDDPTVSAAMGRLRAERAATDGALRQRFTLVLGALLALLALASWIAGRLHQRRARQAG